MPLTTDILRVDWKPDGTTLSLLADTFEVTIQHPDGRVTEHSVSKGAAVWFAMKVLSSLHHSDNLNLHSRDVDILRSIVEDIR